MPTAPIITSSENSILKSLLFEITRFISHIPKNKKVRLFKPDLKRRHPDLNWGSRCCRPMPYHLAIAPYWSGLRGSNSLPPPWQGGALPDELNPHLVVSTILYARYRNLIHKECIGDRNGARTHDL